MNPYTPFVERYAQLYREAKELPLGGFLRPALTPTPGEMGGRGGRSESGAAKALIFSPHPDDECIIGALPYRLLKEAGWRIANVAVTQGSNKDRQSQRLQELRQACGFIGFDLVQTAPNGLERINPQTRSSDPAFWKGCVEVIARILAEEKPSLLFYPHATDWNSTHIGTHFLVMDALATLGTAWSCHLVETEYWGAMPAPNLMVESTAQDVADLVAGVSFHAGEVRRNPFHLFLPAWMQDNVRRGSELVGGQGKAAPDFLFATLYRARRWVNGAIQDNCPPRILSAADNPASLFQVKP